MTNRKGGKALDRWFLRRLGFVLAGLLLVGGLGWLAYDAVMSHQLLATEADLIPQNAGLVAFANSLARPAWRDNCQTCHGANLRGDQSRGVPDLTDGDWLYGAGRISQIAYTISYGIRSGNPKARNLAFMPSFVRPNDPKEKLAPLSPPQIRDVVTYLSALEGHRVDSATAARGGAIYSDTGACYDCHSHDAQGDHDIGAPNLTDNIWLYGNGSPASVFHSIAEGHQGACPAWIDRLKPAVIRALAVFVYSRSQSHSQGAP